MISVKETKMQFTLTGFTPDKTFRVFVFQGILADRTRAEFTVRTDLSLIRKYGIRVQELPLLCREMLERLEEGAAMHAITFGEDEMRSHETLVLADKDAAARKRLTRKVPSPRVAGAAIGFNA